MIAADSHPVSSRNSRPRDRTEKARLFLFLSSLLVTRLRHSRPAIISRRALDTRYRGRPLRLFSPPPLRPAEKRPRQARVSMNLGLARWPRSRTFRAFSLLRSRLETLIFFLFRNFVFLAPHGSSISFRDSSIALFVAPTYLMVCLSFSIVGTRATSGRFPPEHQ